MTSSLFAFSSRLLVAFLLLAATFMPTLGHAEASADYPLAAGDAIRIQVFQNPDLTLETRVSENGSITYPLVGELTIGGMAIATA